MQSPRGLSSISCALEKSALRTRETPNPGTQLILGKLCFVFNACRALETYFHDGASALSGGGEVYFLYLLQEKYFVRIHQRDISKHLLGASRRAAVQDGHRQQKQRGPGHSRLRDPYTQRLFGEGAMAPWRVLCLNCIPLKERCVGILTPRICEREFIWKTRVFAEVLTLR